MLLVGRTCDEVGRKAPYLPPRQAGDEEDTLVRVLTLLDRCAERVQLVQLPTLVVGQEQPHRLEALRKTLRDPRAQLVEPFARERRDLERLRVAVGETAPVQRVHFVDLVHDELDRQLVRADLVQHGVHGGDLLDQPLLGSGAVDDVQDEIGYERLLERRSEPLDELMRQPPDEADGVGDEVSAPLVLEAARRRIERLEEAVAHGHRGVGERVQQRRLADVRVAGECDGRCLGARALLASHVALAGQLLQSVLEDRDAPPRDATVGLELRLARAPGADAAAETLEVLPHAAHAREVVLELRELDLELAFRTHRVLREDVEDQLRAVDDTRLQLVLEQPLLRRRQFVVDEQHLGMSVPVRLLQLVELSLADERPRIGMLTVLDDARHRLDPRGARELFELGELVVRIDALPEHGKDEPALRLEAGRGIGLSVRHLPVIMTPVPQSPDLAARTLQLVDVPSESRREAALVALVRELVPGTPLYDDGEVLLYGDPAAPVVLAGHLDTIPAQGNIPGRIENGSVHGVGASDMKGGVAVMIELARAGAPGRYLFFTREEIPVSESPLPALFASELLAGTQLAVVLEPTDNLLHAGCLGNVQARVTFHGESAHSARPWTGVNAIHELVRGLEQLVRLEPRDVELDGLVYREVVSAVRVEGGIASNVVPAEASVELNFRYAPGRSRGEAEARLRELVPHGAIEILSNAPAAPPALANPLARRLLEVGSLDVAPKQAWTPVAQFAEEGIDAVNFGPGATAYAHRRDEQVPVANLERCFQTLQSFLVDSV